MIPTQELIRPELMADDHLPWLLSASLAAVLLGAGTVGLVVLWSAARRLSRLAASDVEATTRTGPLIGGQDKGVCGRVELAVPGDAVVEVVVDEQAHNVGGGSSLRHTWQEVGRRVDVRPFVLVTDGGESVRVEPGGQLLVVGDLLPRDSDVAMRRQRVCSLGRGQRVVAVGALARTYEGGHGQWRLAPPGAGRMVLADAGRLASRHEPRATFLAYASAAATSLFLFVNAPLTFPFLAATVAGTREDATVLDAEVHATRSHKGGKGSSWCTLTGVSDSGHRFRVDVPTERCPGLMATEGQRSTIPIVRLGRQVTYLGHVPTLHSWGIVGGLCVGLALAFGIREGYRRRIPWYDETRVLEHRSGFVMP